ncbi:hypothetical protein [Nitriliruptor alkaliphilus]|uniref:hypothetical protein n=1 Tax=Nitriliruptor alkaliphilus TaxID=427918 RepID=UPI000698C3C5|nr:hypothetical protein [Nitriliruptor alkaliphilus]
MAPMEDRLRATLQERVDDVTTAPALYRHVKARAARRRRRRLLTAVPAGAAAFGLALAVPLLLERGPDVPRIDDFAEQLATQAGPNVPDRLVVVRDGAVGRLDLATGGTQDLGRLVADGAALATPGEVADDLLAAALDSRRDLSLIGDGVGAVHAGLDVAADGGVVLSPDGRWVALVTSGGSASDLLLMPTAAEDADADRGWTAVRLSEGAVLQDWTAGAQPGTTAVVVRTAQGQLRTVELQEADGDGTSLRTAPNQTDLASLLPTTVLAVASSHLDPERELGGPVYSLVPVAGGVELRVTEAGAITTELDVTALLDGAEAPAVWLDAWGDAAVFGDGERTWIAMRDGSGALLAPRALPDGVTRAAPIAQEIVTPAVAALPGDPDHALLVLDDGTLVADDLATGERTELHPPVNRNMTVHSFTVSVGSTIDDFVAVGYDDGASDDLGLVVYVRRDGGDVVAALTPNRDIPGFASNRSAYVVSPDGRHIAYLGRSGEEAVTYVVPIDLRTAALAVDRAGVIDGGPTFVQDWTGAVTDVGDRSRLVGSLGEEGFVEQTLERTEDGFAVRATRELLPPPGAEVGQASVAFTSQVPGQDGDPRFELIRPELSGGGEHDAALLRYVVGDQVLAERKVPFGGRLGNVSLAARGGTALMVADRVFGAGQPDDGVGRAFVARVATTADGGLEIVLPQVLGDGPIVGALLGGVEGPREATEGTVTDRMPAGEPTVPMVQADATSVWLRPGGGGDDVPLLDLADQGDATVVEVAVRPGGTVDDLTVAALVTEDGVTGLRYVEIVAGEPRPPVTVDDPVLAPNARDDSGLTLHGMAWTPDGASLTWLERLGDDGPTVLRVTGWDDGPGTGEGPSDHDGFETPAVDGAAVRVVDWVDTADGWFLRFLATDGEPGTWVWRFERLADGSLSPDDDGPQFTSGAAAEGPRFEVAALHAFAGFDAVAQPTWRLVDRTVGGSTITRPLPEGHLDLPPELIEGGQLDAAWMHRLPDDGVLLGAEGRAFLHGTDGWVDLGLAVDAEPVR